MPRKLIVDVIADVEGFIEGLKKSSRVVRTFDVDAQKSARVQIQASIQKNERLRKEVAEFKAVASAAKHGSREQIVAAQLAVQAQKRLQASMGTTVTESRTLATSIRRGEREFGRFGRGALAGSGVFRSLGRSLAFASAGFITFATVTQIVRKSIDAATQAAATQRQLAAQFRASNQSLSDYRQQIVDTTLATSRLSGFTEDDLTRAFTAAFRGTNNVAVGLKVQAAAADVSRATGKDLLTITGALTKAYLGSGTALKRLNIILPAGVKGMAALEFVQRRFAGQARAGTTAQQKFSAALFNTEVSIGNALLPTLTRYLDRATKWLDNSKNQARIQRDVQKAVRITGSVLHGLGVGFHDAAVAAGPLIKVFQTMITLGERLNKLFGPHSVFFKLALPEVAAAKAIGSKIGSVFGGKGGGGKGAQGLDFGIPFVGEDVITPARDRRRRIQEVTHAAAPRASLRFQLSILEEKIAKAELTASQRDDRALLQRKVALLQELIAKTKSLKERTTLYQELGSTESQIRAIDKTAADARIAHQQKLLQAAQNQLQKLRAVEDKLRQRIKDIQSQFKDAVDTARQGIGELFAGPVLQPTDEARRRTLGLGRPLTSDAAKLTADLKAQTRQFAAFQKDLNTLAKRGAPAQLIRELRAQGIAAAPEAHALATAGRGTLTAFLKAFGKREALAITTAKTTMKAQLVTLHADRLQLGKIRRQEVLVRVEIEPKGIAKKVTVQQQRTKKGTAAQRGGRNAGVNQ